VCLENQEAVIQTPRDRKGTFEPAIKDVPEDLGGAFITK
jgi:hypothetical protein